MLPDIAYLPGALSTFFHPFDSNSLVWPPPSRSLIIANHIDGALSPIYRSPYYLIASELSTVNFANYFPLKSPAEYFLDQIHSLESRFCGDTRPSSLLIALQISLQLIDPRIYVWGRTIESEPVWIEDRRFTRLP